jgi:transcription elongation factor Elf1
MARRVKEDALLTAEAQEAIGLGCPHCGQAMRVQFFAAAPGSVDAACTACEWGSHWLNVSAPPWVAMLGEQFVTLPSSPPRPAPAAAPAACDSSLAYRRQQTLLNAMGNGAGPLIVRMGCPRCGRAVTVAYDQSRANAACTVCDWSARTDELHRRPPWTLTLGDRFRTRPWTPEAP